jgi:peptide/nickel transport system permease protein
LIRGSDTSEERSIVKVFRDLWQDYRFAVSFCVLTGLVLFACMSFFAPYDPTQWGDVPRDLPPSREHLLGTDSNGQDIFWIASFAARNSLTIALIAGIVSRIIAVLV